MKFFCRPYLLFIFIVTVSLYAHAADDFDPLQAHKLLDKLSLHLSVEEPTAENLQNAANQLISQRDKASLCVKEAERRLEELNTILKDVSQQALSENQKILFAKKIEIEKRLSDCRLYSLRAEEAIQAFSEKALSLQTSALLTRGPHLFTQLEYTFNNLGPLIAHLTLSEWFAEIGFLQLNGYHLAFLALVLVVGFALMHITSKSITRELQALRPIHFFNQLTQSFLAIVQKNRIVIPSFMLILGYGMVLVWMGAPLNAWLTLTSYLLSFTLLYFSIEYFFCPPQPALPYCQISPKYAKIFSLELKTIILLITLSLIALSTLESLNIPSEVYFLARDLAITSIALTIGATLLTLNKMPKFLIHYKKARAFLSLISMTFVCIILIAEWTGFQRFSGYLLKGVAYSLSISFLFYILNDWVQSALSNFNACKYPWQKYLHGRLGVTPQDSLPEIGALKAGAFLLIWGTYIIALVNIWNISKVWTHDMWYSLQQGFTIPSTDLTIVPSRLILAFILFSLGMLLTRYVRNTIQSKVGSSKDKAVREAYGAIFGYSGFTLALIMALLVAGFDLKGLAIIAGALSLGIGFGLQNIVSNFISGIILLLERPIKPGDRIAIGQDEGFVKSVNIRSTCITTLENNDIIVPNADLISGQVINQTFKNYHWRITVKVGVAYGSDIELVKNCLLEAAMNHPEVIQEGPDKPKVFFLEFGESSLNFEMWCIIRNVNLKHFVLSDINFEITKLFNRNGVVIPFPQRDLHIKDSTTLPLEPVKRIPPNEKG